MAQLFLNNARAVLDAAVATTDTLITVYEPVGFPASLATGDFFLVTLYKDSRQYGEDHEVIKVTAIAPEGWTVERGVEGVALAHVEGERIEARLTGGTMNGVEKTRKAVNLMQLGIELL